MDEQEWQAIQEKAAALVAEQPTDEEIFLAWRKAINRDRSALRSLTDKLALADRQRTELRAENAALRAKLDAVPDYAESYREDCAYGPFTESFDDWYARKQQPVQP